MIKSVIITEVEIYYKFKYICSVFLGFYFELFWVINGSPQRQTFFEPKVILSIFYMPFNGLDL